MKKLFFVLFSFFLLSAAYTQSVEISQRLQQRMNSLNPLDYVKVLIMMKDQVDVMKISKDLYSTNASLQTRSETIINSLMLKAEQTQGPLMSYIKQQKTYGKIKQVKPFWIVNMIMIEATAEVINQIAYRTDVGVMDLDAELSYDKPISEEPAPDHIESSEIGLRVINAHMLWQIGITGLGRIVMGDDTGVDATHPALNYKWRGTHVPWYQAWIDPYGNTSFPTDCDNHGTHTVGTMTGKAGTDTIGVAPDAEWIAGKTICGGNSTSNHMTSWQWAMNPDSNASTTYDMPDAIGNSWWDPSISNECTSIYVNALNSMEAVGIAVVFSCGNSGPGASTITRPKNINTNIVNCFSTGNINGNVSFPYPINSSSSRGPSICGGSGSLLIKPEVVAPGTSVRSSVIGGGYSYYTGTSMACPHVVGSVALLRQAAPNLTGPQILEILYNTAVDLGTTGEDNTYGKGVIDVWAAYQQLGPPPAHDFAVGPFLSLPTQFYKDSIYNIKAKVRNLGTSNESNVPIKFFVNGTLQNTVLLSLDSLESDSVSYAWTPAIGGMYSLAIASALSNDTNRLNDTVRTTVDVQGAAPLFCDDFSSGTGNWTITNNGGTCVWQIFSTPFPNSYTLPPTSSSPVFSADSDECGSGTTLLSTATLTNSINCSGRDSVKLEFDNDWNAIDAQDQAIVDVSYNGGSTWTNIITWGGTDVRNTHEVHSLPGATNNPNVKIRFVSVQPGWDWWWTIDNVCIRGEVVTGLANNGNEIPKQYSLSQNYPNPFNPSTKIKFDLPKQGFVSLKVYDVLGKEVANLVNEVKTPGSYVVNFNGENISSGVYYYRIDVGNYVETKKMLLIK